MKKKKIACLLALVLGLSLGLVMVPMAETAQAQEPDTGTGQTLNVAKWTGPTDTGVSGRETVLYDGDNYHMWYSSADEETLYHTSSATPGNFTESTTCDFGDTAPVEVGSVTVVKEGEMYYMIAYGSTDKVFNIYTSTNGNAWENKGLVFDGTGLSDYNKIDGPYLFKDGDKYRLYFQVKNADGARYEIYTAEATDTTLAAIAGTGDTVDFTLADDDNPVLTPEEGEPDAWDGAFVMHPWVVKDGDVYYMWYSAHEGSGSAQQIGVASSTDGYTWVKSPGNPIMLPATGYAEPSVIIDDDGTWQMWCMGTGGTINYLTATGPFEFSSIQAAVNAASAGDTINVAAGTYTEDVNINKQVNLIGIESNDDRPTIIGKLTINHTEYSGEETTLIQDIDFEAASADSIYINGASEVTIKDCNFDGKTDTANPANRAIEMQNSNDITIDNCTFQGGYYVTIQASSRVNNLTVKDSTITGCKSGINLQIGDNLVVENTDISVIAKGATNDTYCVRFASAPDGSGAGMTITGGTFTVDKDGLTASSGTYHSAIIIRAGATGTLKANQMNIDGEVVNLATEVQLDATNNWWGSVNGPSHASNTFNVGSQGSAASGSINYAPWLNAATPTGVSFAPVTNGENGYASIQAAIDDADSGDTINVAAGTYTEQVVINKNLTLEGAGAESTIIVAPESPASFRFTESGSSWEPVVFAFGGTNTSGSIAGTDTITVTISGFTIDGADRVPTQRSAGILLRNASGSISNNTVQNMSIDGKETFGILVYGDSEVTIEGNNVSGYARGGIGASGDNSTCPDPNAIITGNTVTGPGMDKNVTWAPNGIQIGYGATGEVTGNIVSGNGYPGTDWTGSGILVVMSNGVKVHDNTVTGNETGIGTSGVINGTWIYDNIIDGNTFGISIQNQAANTMIKDNIITNSSCDGIDICNFTNYGGPPTGTTIQGNTITGNNTKDDATSGGIWVDDGVDGNEVSIHLNNISGNNGFGVINASTTDTQLDATSNWWGDASGPTHPSNGLGTGDAVSDNVNFVPWLDDEYPDGEEVYLVHIGEKGYASIQAAVDATEPGDTITVGSGIYVGNIIIGTDNVTLIGDGAKLEGTGDNPVITIGDINVTVKGFEVDPGTHGIDISLISAGNVVTIEDTHIFANTRNGINVDGVYGTLNVINSHIYNNEGTGIYINNVDGGFVNIEGNTIEDNDTTGIHIASIDADSAVNINYNSIVGNTNGVVNGSAIEIDVTNNWWGDVAGPDTKGNTMRNPYEAKTGGDSVSDNVVYLPWLIQGELNAGWNIWSFPIALDEATTEDLFMAPLFDAGVSAAYYFDSTTQLWGNPGDAGPMDAIYVKVEEPATVRCSISSDATFPAQKEMKAGWNFIGLAELYAMDVEDALISINLVAGDLTGYSHVISPSLTGASWIHFRGAEESFFMLPTKGYWVFMVNDGVLGGFVSTPIIEVEATR